MLKHRLIALLGFALLLFRCTEPDTTAPEVSMPNLTQGMIMSEICEITCSATDENDIASLELMIDGVSEALVHDVSEYTFLWNTLDYPDASNHTIMVLAVDESGNEGESELLTVIVDQTPARPSAVNVTGVYYDTDSLTVTWEISTAADFDHYELVMGSDTTSFVWLAEIQNPGQTSFSISEFDPLTRNYFRVTVYDTLGLFQVGNYLSNSLHQEPQPVDVTAVSYTPSTMTIQWETYVTDLVRMRTLEKTLGRSSFALTGTDFVAYELYHAISETGARTLIASIHDPDSTRYDWPNFNPAQENWFWVKVIDFWGLSSLGTGGTHPLDAPPEAVDINAVWYDTTAMTISWSASPDSDFEAYKILFTNDSQTEMVTLDSIFEQQVTTYELNDFNPLLNNVFQIETVDIWGLTTHGAARGHDQELPPAAAQQFSIELGDDSYRLRWSKSQAHDFKAYDIYQSFTSDMQDRILLGSVYTVRDTVYPIQPLLKGMDLFYEIETRDHWDLTSASNIESIHIPITFFKILSEGTAGYGLSVQCHSDGGYLYLARQTNNLNYLAKLDPYGAVQWTANFTSVGHASTMELTADGGAVVVGKANTLTAGINAWLCKIDVNGNQVWDQRHGSAYDEETGRSVRQTADGGFIVCGVRENDTTGQDELFLLKTDINGDQEWMHYFPGVANTQGFSAVETPDGDFMAVGLYTSAGYSAIDIWLLKTNAQGEEIWNHTLDTPYGSRAASIRETDDGNFILCGNYFTSNNLSDAWLLKVDTNGNLIWDTVFGGWSSDEGEFAQQTADGGFIMTGMRSDGSDTQDMWLIKTNAQGDLQWARTYGQSQMDIGYWVQQTPDDGYIFTGRVYLGYENEMMVLFKTDELGKIFYPGTSWARP